MSDATPKPADDGVYLVISARLTAGKRTKLRTVEAATKHAAKLLGGKYSNEGDTMLVVKVMGTVAKAPPPIEFTPIESIEQIDGTTGSDD
jgi:hypothetical protein